MTFTLRPFQMECVDLFEPYTLDPNVIIERSRLLGDDMGLGKTLEASCIDIRSRWRAKQTGAWPWRMYTLVTCPGSGVLDSWRKHYARFHPEAKVFVIDRKNRRPFVDELKKAAAGTSNYHIFICHWEAHRLDDTGIALKQVKWFHMIADEVHRIKNRQSQLSTNFKKCKAFLKTGVSGTFGDNKPDDGWSPLNWLWPNEFRSYTQFYNDFVDYDMFVREDGKLVRYDSYNPEHRAAPKIKRVTGMRNADQLHAQLQGKYIRRRKSDVAKDLPPKIYKTIPVELGPKQRRAYDNMRHQMIAWLGEHEDEPFASPSVMVQLMRLQQLALAYGDVEDGWVTRTIEGEKRKVPGKIMKLADPSAKLDALMTMIEDMPSTEPLVIFSQSRQILELTAKRLDGVKESYGLFTGKTSQTKRNQIIDNFQDGKIRFFLGTIAAGGEGITLTRANRMVFFDRTWNPSKNIQTEDREHRIGQSEVVEIIDLVGINTIDLGRNQEIQKKWEHGIAPLLGDNVESIQDQIGAF